MPITRAHILILMLLAAAACTKVPVGPGYDDALSPEGRPLVPVTLNLSVAPTETGGPDTKTDYEPDSWGVGGQASAVKTILLLQFEWQNNTDAGAAKLIGQQFIQTGGSDKAELIASEAKNTVFVIANADGKLPLARGITLEQFLAEQNFNVISTLDDGVGSGIWYCPDGSNRYLRMSGSVVVDKVRLNSTVGDNENPVSLKRNCSKIVIKVKNTSTSSDKVTIGTVRLRDVNRKYYYVTNYTGFSDPWSSLNPYRFDLEEEVFPASYNDDATKEQTYTYYVPANLRGSVSGDTGQKNKNWYAPQGATRFCVYATHGASSQHIIFTYYLGANLTDNFDLEANHKYTYTIAINGSGNQQSDARIEDTGEVVFGKEANCYMLNPPSQSGLSRDFKIPVRRAAVFWNEKQSSSDASRSLGVYGAGNSEPFYTLTDDSDWVMNIVWNEILDQDGNPVPDNNLLITSSGTGFSDVLFKVRVTSGMHGNAVVALKKKAVPVPDGKQISDPSNTATYVSDDKYFSNNDILWSWHLWVTDYNPYRDLTPVSDTYVYPAQSGEIHRYAGSAWNSNTYENAFVMDRNLGATAAAGIPYSYGLYYQWGRKDPFRYEGNEKIAQDDTGEPIGVSDVGKNIRFSVHNPTTVIYGSRVPWTSSDDDLGMDDNRYWEDAFFESHTDDPSAAGYDYCEAKKSVYDPCPYGWRVTRGDEFQNFSSAGKYEMVVNGFNYYPGGKTDPAKGVIFYPSAGRVDYSNGEGVNRGSQPYYYGTNYRIRTGTSSGVVVESMALGDGFRRTNTASVRCIRFSFQSSY